MQAAIEHMQGDINRMEQRWEDLNLQINFMSNTLKQILTAMGARATKKTQPPSKRVKPVSTDGDSEEEAGDDDDDIRNDDDMMPTMAEARRQHATAKQHKLMSTATQTTKSSNKDNHLGSSYNFVGVGGVNSLFTG